MFGCAGDYLMEIAIFFVCTLLLVFFYRRWRSHVGFVFFAITAAYAISILWVPYYVACNLFLNAGWQYPIKPDEFLLIGAAFCIAVIFCVVAKAIFSMRSPAHVISNVERFSRSSRGRVYVFGGAVIGAGSILVLIASKGVTLSVGNYGSRFESNTGTGVFSILSYVLVSVATMRVISKPTRWTAFSSLLIAVAFGVILFLTLGGERNYLVAAVAPIFLLSYMLRIIGVKRLIFYVLLSVFAITGLAVVRYGNQLSSGIWLLIATYTRDTIFPVESLGVIFHQDNLRFVGFEYFFDQFYSIVPRFLWPEKPVYLDTIAYYFTEQIYAYGKGLIIAPTGIGSLYLMGGWLYVLIGVVAAASVFFVCDYLVFNKNIVFFICLWPTLFFSFFSFRESVELGMFKILVHSLGTVAIYYFSMGIYALLPKKRVR